MSKVSVALATESQREQCYRLAYDVFVTELGTMSEVADHERGVLRDDMIEHAELLCATVGDDVVGCVGVLFGSDVAFPPLLEEHLGIDRYSAVVPRSQMAICIRFLVDVDHRSTMLPLTLIREVTKLQGSRGVEVSFADCQPHLLSLYEAIGFRQCGATFDQPGFGLMVPLVAVSGDVAHFDAIQSPLRDLIRPSARSAEIAAAVTALLPGAPDDDRTAAWADAYATLTESTGGLFEGLLEHDVDRLLAASHVIDCVAGQQIVVAAQGTRTMYVVLDGVVEVRSATAPVARLGPGEAFGEIAFLLRSKRTADVVAVSPTARVVAMDDKTVKRLIDTDSALAAALMMNLAKTLAVRVVGNAPNASLR